MFQINNPPTWLAAVLRIVNGSAPQRIGDELFPVVELTQGGWAFVKSVTSRDVTGSLGGPTVETITADATQSKLVKLSHTNPGSANCLLTVRLTVPGGPSLVREYVANTLSASTTAWGTIGSGRQWFVIPPGWRLEIEQGGYATTAGLIHVIEVVLPNGVDLSSS